MSHLARDTKDHRILIFAPTGKDGVLIARVLEESGILAESCPTFEAVFQEMQDGAGTVVIAEEGLNRAALDRLGQYISNQPSWSDFPLVLLTKAGHVSALQHRLRQTQKRLGNVLLLERPVRPETLVSTLSGVLRSRERQYQVRDHLKEKQQSETALRDSEKRFRDLANTIPQLAWMAHPDGQIFWYNDRWYDYTGTKQAEMEGWGWTAVLDAATLPDVLRRWKSALAKGEPFEMTYPLRAADGTFRPFLTLVRPVFDSSGHVARWFGTNTDVSSQKRAEEALIRTEKLAAAGRLAASIAHEINNPLEAVTNLIYLVETNPELTDESRTLLQKAQSELGRASEITTHTLRFYRDSTKPAPVKLSELLDSVIALYQARLTQSKVQVRKRYREHRAYIGSPGELRQVLANLIGNAIDAMRRGGTLHVRIHPARSPASGDEGFRLVVADTGHGMHRDILRRIFEPFFTTKDATGTGLGLFVSKEIIEKSGGQLAVRSSNRPGLSGTIFTIFLPVHSRRSVSTYP